jgi:hypothetical protein
LNFWGLEEIYQGCSPNPGFGVVRPSSRVVLDFDSFSDAGEEKTSREGSPRIK